MTAGRSAWLDLLLWAGFTLLLVALRLSHGDDGPELRHWWQVAGGSAVLAVAVALSRRYPLVSLTLVLPLVLFDQWAVVPIFVMSFLVGRRQPEWQRALWTFTGMFAVVAVGLLVSRTRYLDVLDVLWIGTFAVLLPWLVGWCVRLYRDLTTAGWTRAEQLEREQRIVADQARLRERSRIAQDMHDSLGHELSLIALRAGALELSTGSDEARALRLAASTATEHLREVIGVLREDSDPTRMQPADEDIASLVRRAEDSGVPVTLHERGERTTLPPKVERAAHRIVQESLTNATKHAPGARIDVLLSFEPDETLVSVRNGRPPRAAPPGAGGGHGLIGLHERVRLLGGTLDAEPRDGGFEVSARLPHSASALPVVESESARQREDRRRRLRRVLVAAIAVPAAVGGVLLLAAGLVYADYARDTVMDAESFTRLHSGQSAADAAEVLPRNEITERPVNDEPPRPEGAKCRFYRSTHDLFRFDPAVYRVCFADGILVAKDLLPVR